MLFETGCLVTIVLDFGIGHRPSGSGYVGEGLPYP
jgi:hypothetical protein